MENLQIILSLAGTVVGLIVTALTFIAKFVKSTKAKKVAEQVIAVGNAIIPYIEQAETFSHYTGAEKKEFVLTKANQYAIEKGIDFDATSVSAKIEELVTLTKQVNTRDKDKTIVTATFATA